MVKCNNYLQNGRKKTQTGDAKGSQKILDVEAYHFEGKYYLTKQMVADFYQVDTRTIERYTENNKEELERNGYFLCKGKRLKDFKLQFGPDKNVGAKTTLAMFFIKTAMELEKLLRKFRVLVIA